MKSIHTHTKTPGSKPRLGTQGVLKCEALSKLVAGGESHDWKGMDQLRSSTRYSVGSLKIDWMARNRNGSVRGTY